MDCWEKDQWSQDGERGQREEQLQRQVNGDAAQGPVVKAKKAPSALCLDEWDGHLVARHVEYRGWCPFCVGEEVLPML